MLINTNPLLSLFRTLNGHIWCHYNVISWYNIAILYINIPHPDIIVWYSYIHILKFSFHGFNAAWVIRFRPNKNIIGLLMTQLMSGSSVCYIKGSTKHSRYRVAMWYLANYMAVIFNWCTLAVFYCHIHTRYWNFNPDYQSYITHVFIFICSKAMRYNGIIGKIIWWPSWIYAN